MTLDRLPAGIATITGAAGGMGSQCARLMAETGWRELLLCDLDEAKFEAIASPLRAKGTRVEPLPGDISNPAWPVGLLAKLGEREIAALIHIRHYGLLASSHRETSISRARELLALAPPPEDEEPDQPVDTCQPCPCCGGRMIIIDTFERWRQPRAPPQPTESIP